MTDTEIKIKGMKILTKNMGLVEAERFVSLIQRERFDYTEWRKDLFTGMSGEDISKNAMKHRKNTDN
jgi:hypothetical protein